MADPLPDLAAAPDRKFAGLTAICAAVTVTIFAVEAIAGSESDRPGRFVVLAMLAAALLITIMFLRRGFTPRVMMAGAAMLMVLGVAVGAFLRASLDASVVLPLAGAVLALAAARGRPLMILLALAYGASMVGEVVGYARYEDSATATTLNAITSLFESALMLAFAYGLLWWVGDRWWRADEQARLSLTSQRRLLEVNERLLSTFDPQGVFDLIADSLKSVMAYDNLTIYRVDRSAGVLRPVVARDRFAKLIIDSTFAIDTGITGWVVAHGTAECVNDTIHDPRSANIPGTPDEQEALIVVPLIAGGEVAGTLNVGRMGGEEARFSAAEFELARLFAGQASIALRNAETLRAVATRAETDALTGLRNRGAFDDRLRALVADFGVQPMVLVMLDLDGFKRYNDVHGHPAGDALLQAAGRAITSAVRDGDLCFRYGGDEFALLLPRTDEEAGRQIAERVRQAIEAVDPSGSAGVTASIGLASHPRDAVAADDLVARTDSALYRAKDSGGNRVQTWSESAATRAG
jgi:diguanylate cyclase (GGDEF)-like protein